MFQSRSFKVVSNIESLPFAELAESCRAVERAEVDTLVKEFCSLYGIKHKSWVYPQVLARIGSWTLNKNSLGKYCALDLLKTNCSNSPFDMGCYYFATSNERGLDKQYLPTNAPYSKLVPLVLAAFRKMRNIKYSEWDTDKLDLVVHTTLWQAMTCEYYPYSREDLLQFRDMGLTTGSGRNAGTIKSAVSTYNLNGLPATWEVLDPETGEIAVVSGPKLLPVLAKMMLCQTWCAHPQNRSSYMILDPLDWDRMPEPLVDADPLKPDPKPTMSKLPW